MQRDPNATAPEPPPTEEDPVAILAQAILAQGSCKTWTLTNSEPVKLRDSVFSLGASAFESRRLLGHSTHPTL